MIVMTKSGSEYEVDAGRKRARNLAAGEPWRSFEAYTLLFGRLIIVWGGDDSIVTSPIVRVRRDDGTEVGFT